MKFQVQILVNFLLIAFASAQTDAPTRAPTKLPTSQPSRQPSGVPTNQPLQNPTSAPSYKAETWGEVRYFFNSKNYYKSSHWVIFSIANFWIKWIQVVYDKRRTRSGGLCENHCSGHGTCEMNNNCLCYNGPSGEAEWTGPDCSLRTCPKDFAWVGAVVGANNLHPWAECSNKGLCDRATGLCSCFAGYEGVACQRTICPNNCNNRGTCWPEKHLAAKAGRTYSVPWDAMKHVGCYCDAGYRGPSCEFQGGSRKASLFFSRSFSYFKFVFFFLRRVSFWHGSFGRLR